MIDIIHVIKVEKLGGYRLRLRFSDGSEGERDFWDMIAEGGEMVEPLRDQAFFAGVFIECGVLMWPNGFALDSIALHMEMKEGGLLRGSGNRGETRAEHQMLELVHVQKVEPRGGYRLRLRFSDGAEGDRDFSDVIAEGGEMIEALRDPAFACVFIECGALAWPNGFDLDSTELHREMKEFGLLQQATAA